MRVAVVGAGMVGLVAARRLVRAGHDVTLFDRDVVPGGLAASFVPASGGDPLERFYHHVFQSDRAFVALLAEMGLTDRMIWPAASTVCWTPDGFHSLDSMRSLLAFTPLPLLDRLRLGLALGILKLAPSAAPFERSLATSWLARVAGPAAYRAVFEPLFRAKFGPYADRITLGWFWARIHDRTARLGYLVGGFALLYEALADDLRRAGASVRLGTAVKAIRPAGEGTLHVLAGGEAGEAGEAFDRVLSTQNAAIAHRLLGIAEPRERPMLGARCLVLALDRPMTGNYWINVCRDDVPFMVVVEQTNLVGPERYGGRHLLYLGNYAPSFDRRTPQELIDQFLPALALLNPAFERGWIVDAWIFAAAEAQPVVTPQYRSTLPPLETPVPGVYNASMEHVYPHDRGQNYAIELGERVAGLIAAS